MKSLVSHWNTGEKLENADGIVSIQEEYWWKTEEYLWNLDYSSRKLKNTCRISSFSLENSRILVEKLKTQETLHDIRAKHISIFSILKYPSRTRRKNENERAYRCFDEYSL